MNIWMVMLIGGFLTFGMRLSFIYLFGRFDVPETLRRALHYVPPAVLTAIVVPELLLTEGRLYLSLGNERLLAGLAAVLAAWLSRNMLVTILVGMGALIVFQLLGG